jgi:hypothetical protein
MAKDKDYTYASGDKVPRSTAPNWISTRSGFTHAVRGMENNITGTPPQPNMRGNAHPVGGDPIGRGNEPSSNNVMSSFFMDRGEK